MTASAERANGPYAAFRLRDFRLFQAARFTSTVAIQMQSVAVAWQMYELTGRAIDLGYVGLAQFVPAIVLSLVTGDTVDRVDRRRVLLVCQCGCAFCALFLWWLAQRTHPTVGLIYLALVLFGVVRAFAGPANQALLPDIVPAPVFGNAVAWSETIWQGAAILGPALGGFLYGIFRGAAGVFALSATLSTVALIALAALRVRTGRMEQRAPGWERVLAGVRYVWNHKIVLGAISLDLFAVLLGGAVALLPIYARDILHTGPWGLGLLRSAPSIGASLMALLLAFRPLVRRAGAVLLSAVAVFGIATIVFGVSRSFALSVAALIVMGSADMISVVVRHTLVQLQTPAAMRGRVSAVNSVFIGASNQLGDFESGATAALVGTVPAVVLGGIGTCAIVVLWALIFPQLARVDRLQPASAD